LRTAFESRAFRLGLDERPALSHELINRWHALHSFVMRQTVAETAFQAKPLDYRDQHYLCQESSFGHSLFSFALPVEATGTWPAATGCA
jgi:hypothetical protein